MTVGLQPLYMVMAAPLIGVAVFLAGLAIFTLFER